MGNNHSVVGLVSKNYITIRDCASAIMAALTRKEKPDLSKYNAATQRDAYKLLMFENIIRRRDGYELTERGAKHIETNGPQVYKKTA